MRVHIYDVDHQGGLFYRATAKLAECFPSDPDEVAEAERALRERGRYSTGGGAAPRVTLIRTRDI